MMNHIKFETATRLKEAGFPQPEPKAGQFWYIKVYEGGTAGHCALCICVLDSRRNLNLVNFNPVQDAPTYLPLYNDRVFTPALEDITALLPSVFTLEMRDGRHSCKIDTDQNLIQTQADNFAEAAALAWLSLNTPQ